EVQELPEGLELGCKYRVDLFDAAMVDRLLEHLEITLDRALGAPHGPLVELSTLPDSERALLLDTWNRTEAPIPDGGLHQLVEAQVRRTPDRVAVRFEGEELTYRAFDARANQLARFLAAHGAGPGKRVGVCLERSLELPIALYAVLKTGAAYVPFDASHPPERV